MLNGTRLREEVRDIVQLIAEAGAILATGHLSPEESRILIEHALAAGVRRISVTHPEWGVTAMPVASQRQLAASGAVFFERCLISAQPGLQFTVPFDVIVRQIRAVGVETTIAATDHGLPEMPEPAEAMRSYIRQLAAAGFTAEEIGRMVRDNPARLLRLA